MPPTQSSLLDLLPPPPQPEWKPDIEEIRTYLNGLLATARAAEVMPWEETRARTFANLMRQMTNWLPDDEATALRTAFVAEYDRLGWKG